MEIFQRGQNKTGINPLTDITLKTGMTEENEDFHNCNYINLSLHDFIITFKRKRIEKKRDDVIKKE